MARSPTVTSEAVTVELQNGDRSVADPRHHFLVKVIVHFSVVSFQQPKFMACFTTVKTHLVPPI